MAYRPVPEEVTLLGRTCKTFSPTDRQHALNGVLKRVPSQYTRSTSSVTTQPTMPFPLMRLPGELLSWFFSLYHQVHTLDGILGISSLGVSDITTSLKAIEAPISSHSCVDGAIMCPPRY
jgi:hypothetical protein